MSEFEKITPQLSRLFLRLDAAMPTDPVLQAAANVWQERRGNALLPGILLVRDLSAFIYPHAVLAHRMKDGQDWTFSHAGTSARGLLGSEAGGLREEVEPALAHRLETLFNLVAQKGEPYAAMFELQAPTGQRQLCEVYAAPVAPQNEAETGLLAVLNWRAEAMS